MILLLASFLTVFSGWHLLPMLLAASDCGGLHSTSSGSTGQQAVALIDQLGGQYPTYDFAGSIGPNYPFAKNISETAKSAGYGFDYYPAETATMDFFANLPSHNYSMVILRTHGTGLVAADPSAIVTSERYNQYQHTFEQLTDKVVSVEVNGTSYFALGPSFISDVMCGRFPGTVVLAMFCEGTGVAQLAKAFLGKGAGAYIGWNSVVTLSHTDQVFESLVKLLVEGKPVNWSVQKVMTTLGQDPFTGARLVSYSQGTFPSEGNQWWQQYWYIISVGTAASIFGLAKTRNALKTAAKHQ